MKYQEQQSDTTLKSKRPLFRTLRVVSATGMDLSWLVACKFKNPCDPVPRIASKFNKTIFCPGVAQGELI
ncbi:hypothetical protein OGATHE_002481 [Ogataea polymorpha]|uniref:Uncharacterized protein n=1 Tax=Ogataea polymorpha TaxID=460523 RepID=A0A9P8PDV6_9ASCO|nr:hypothetical protein OGATHE_002481 [Ogataea polymorpha]